jgi:lipopolysaccharide/colanic/teichoic acid biosynthesis glycosyltransferase
VDSKRAFDFAIGTAALVTSIPVQAVVAAAVRVSMGRPILFRQTRVGLAERRFELIKFRTMLPADEARGRVGDAERLTRLGRFLRSTSLDELPTLWNVVRGDMSLVGPRPLLEQYLPRYTREQARRHEVRPGLTGLAQVSGRNAISWDEKFRLDVAYVDNQSFWEDLKILARSVATVVRREGISASGDTSMPEFFGSDSQ